MYGNQLAHTGGAALVLGSVVLPLWVVALCTVLVGAGLLMTRFHPSAQRARQKV